MSINQHRDSRRPVSITQIGKYTVTIFDQEAYDASIAKYDTNEHTTSRPAPEKFARPAFIKQKRIAAYNWMPAPDALKREKDRAS